MCSTLPDNCVVAVTTYATNDSNYRHKAETAGGNRRNKEILLLGDLMLFSQFNTDQGVRSEEPGVSPEQAAWC